MFGLGVRQLGPENNQDSVKISRHYKNITHISYICHAVDHGGRKSMAGVVFADVAHISESSDEGGAAAVGDGLGPAEATNGQDADVGRRNRKSFKRKRKQIAEAVKERLSSRKCLENVLQKACTGCKRRCLEKFKPGGQHFERLLEFRKQWTNLHKIDQDRLIFDRVRSVLAPEAGIQGVSDAPSTQWSMLGVRVCLKAFKRLHCLGLLDEDVMKIAIAIL